MRPQSPEARGRFDIPGTCISPGCRNPIVCKSAESRRYYGYGQTGCGIVYSRLCEKRMFFPMEVQPVMLNEKSP